MTTNPTITDADLLPCPFCGADAVQPVFDEDYNVFIAGCSSCPAILHSETPDEAIAAWNTRHREQAVAEKDRRIAELEAENARLREAGYIDRAADLLERLSADIEAIRSAMRRYLPPDSGITAEQFASEVIGIVDGERGDD